MAYNIVYRMEFKDVHFFTPASWRIDFLQKDGLQPAQPIMLEHMGTEPLVFERSQTDDDKYTPIVGSKATISYVYDGTTACPPPEVFINIEEDTWMIIVYKNDALYWKGFVKPDNASYPWLYPPYEFSLNATDYISFMKGKQMNLDATPSFLYDWITIGDFINRTIFDAVGYEDAAVKLLMDIKPKVLPADKTIVDGLYLHTDAFYDITNGPAFVYDALQKLVEAMGCRLIYSAGVYWIQRIADLDQDSYDLITVTPDNINGAPAQDSNVSRILGSSATLCDLYYLDRSQMLRIIPAIKQQKFRYTLQAFNRLKNFDWRYYDGRFFPDWNYSQFSPLVQERLGAGTISDPFRARLSGSDDPGVGAFIGQQLTVAPGQFINLQMKAKCNYSTGVRMNVALMPLSSGGSAWYMNESGDWTQDTAIPTTYQEILLTVDRNTRMGSLDIQSKQIPGGASSYTLFFNIIGPTPANDPSDPMPPGEWVYNELYPVFLRLHNNSYEEIDQTITNNKRYSYIPEDQSRFFMDAADNGLSNCLFYNNGGAFTALPVNNWRNLKDATIPDRTINEILARNVLDQSHEPDYVFEGDIYANNLEFHNIVVLKDLDHKRCMLLRDTYRVRACKHTIQAAEVKTENSGTGTYQVLPIQRER